MEFLSPAINLSPVSLSPAKIFTGVFVTGNKFIAGVAVTGVTNTGEKYIAGIKDTGDY
jgi:hypothetical protein